MVYPIMIILLSALWFVSFYLDGRKLRNGFYFLLSYTAIVVGVAELANYFAWDNLYTLALYFIIFPLIIFPFFLLLLLIQLFTSTTKLLKNEGVRLHNLLGAAFGIAFIIWAVVLPIVILKITITWLHLLVIVLSIYFGYIFCVFMLFSIAAVTYALVPKRRKTNDYIIVLGAGLLEGIRVTPLLASRIDRGIKQYQLQVKLGGTPPILVMSGGQGADELISEAEAMRRYAVAQGMDPEHILIEDKSTNTYQNMLYARNLIDEKIGANTKGLFATNNFHVFRAGLYARKAGLRADGIGSKTKLYYFLNAVIREFAAILVMYKWVQIIVLFIMLLGCLAFYMLLKFMS